MNNSKVCPRRRKNLSINAPAEMEHTQENVLYFFWSFPDSVYKALGFSSSG